ncbi:MAG: hypothetical protein VKI63_02570 [Cyanobium sp.]|nr:hypothetical protein [Cyanobium sp.]
MDDEVLFADGFEDAFLGISEPQPGRPSVAVYSFLKCVDVLMERDGMSEPEAVEFMDFNVTGAWVGERTPIFVS